MLAYYRSIARTLNVEQSGVQIQANVYLYDVPGKFLQKLPFSDGSWECVPYYKEITIN